MPPAILSLSVSLIYCAAGAGSKRAAGKGGGPDTPHGRFSQRAEKNKWGRVATRRFSTRNKVTEDGNDFVPGMGLTLNSIAAFIANTVRVK